MKKAFDCVEMKNRLQRELRRKMAGMTPEEEREYRRNLLATSDAPIAQWWRERNAAKTESASVKSRNA